MNELDCGFTGTRDGMTSPQETAFAILLGRLRPIRFRHGDCLGADAQAHAVALRLGTSIIIHPPLLDKDRAFCEGAAEVLPARHYLVRNRDIVQLSNCLIAAPKGRQVQRSGTWYTVRAARRWKRSVYIVWPDGRIQEPLIAPKT